LRGGWMHKLTSLSEPIAQKRLEIGDGVDLLNGFLEVVAQTAKSDPGRSARGGLIRLHLPVLSEPVIENHVTGAVISIAWLAHGTDIDHHLAFTERVLVVDLLGCEKLEVLGEDARDVGMPLKTIPFDELKQ